MVNTNFWQNKRVLVTGHTGFKGGWLCLLLKALGARVGGLSLQVEADAPLFVQAGLAEQMTHALGDIRQPETLNSAVTDFQPEVIFHLAAQSLVSEGYASPVDTFHTNVDGTMYLLESVRQHLKDPATVVVVTSDKCYLNPETPHAFVESDPLGGHDPYSASKAMAEIVTAAYRQSFLQAQGHQVSTARAGNVIGAGDCSQNRLVPDIFRAYEQRETLVLRYPEATRPWQHILDALYGYLLLAEHSATTPSLAGAFNFGPPAEAAITVESLCQHIRAHIVAQGETNALQWRYDTAEKPHESGFLQIDAGRAHEHLHWQPQLNLADTLQWTVAGYLAQDLPALVQSQIQRYLEKIT